MKKLYSKILLVAIFMAGQPLFSADLWNRKITKIAPAFIENMPAFLEMAAENIGEDAGYNALSLACILSCLTSQYNDLFGIFSASDDECDEYSKIRQNGYELLIQYFIDHGCDIHQKFHVAKFAQSPNVTYSDSTEISIMVAAIAMDKAMISALLSKGLILNTQDQLSTLLFLVEEGCDFIPLDYKYEADYGSLVMFFNTCDKSVQQEVLAKYPELKQIFIK